MNVIKLTILISCLGFLQLKAQNLEKIEQSNTFFILFEDGLLTQRAILKLLPDKPISYQFYRMKENIKIKYPFKFYYAEYFDSDDQANKINQTMVYSIHKSFLRKNKDVIITRDFMEKIGKNKLIDLLYGANKYIFIIDKSEINGNKIIIRKVLFSPQLYE